MGKYVYKFTRGWLDHVQVITAYALRLNSRAGTEGFLFNLRPLANTGFGDAQY